MVISLGRGTNDLHIVSSWCHPINFIKIKNGFTFLVLAYPDFSRKRSHCCCSLFVAWSCDGGCYCRKSTPLHVATAHMTISPSPTASQLPFARRVVERRTVHSGAVRDRRVPSDTPLPLQTHEDSAIISKPQRVSLFNRLTSKFSKR